MAGVWCFTPFLLLWFAAVSPAAESKLIRVPEDFRVAGVHLLIEEGGNYTLNFTAAKDACRSVGVTIATRVQMQQALQQGLEMCKYGWIAEQVAVVPRLSRDAMCGKNNIGLVEWAVELNTEFGVFCFSESQETLHTSTAAALTIKTPASTALTIKTPAPTTPANGYGHFLNSFTSCFILLTSVLSVFHAHFL